MSARALELLLLDLVRSVPESANLPEQGSVEVRSLEMTLPIEAVLQRRGQLHARAPQGRLHTGFDLQTGRLSLRAERSIR